MKPPLRFLNYEVQRTSGLVNASKCQEGGAFQLHRDRPHPMYLFIWLFICILYNKTVNISSSKLSKLPGGGLWEHLSLQSHWTEVWVPRGTHWLHLKWGASCETEPLNLWSWTLTPGGWCQNWIKLQNTQMMSGELENWLVLGRKLYTFGVRSVMSRETVFLE